MKPPSLFWPLSASLVSFATGAGISWIYLSGLPPAVTDSPMWLVMYSLAGLVPLLVGGAMAIKILAHLGLASSGGEAWRSGKPSHWFRLVVAISIFAGGLACSIVVVSYMWSGLLHGRLRDMVLIAAIAAVPLYVGVRVAWWGAPHARELVWVGGAGVDFWSMLAAATLSLGGLVVTYLYYAEGAMPGGYVANLLALLDILPGLLPAIWGIYVARSLVDLGQLAPLVRERRFLPAATRFLVGLVVSAMVVAIGWRKLAHLDWRELYLAGVLIAIPAALGLWAGGRALKRAEHAG